ncbi:MAG: leucine-rich repeat domain-containing protein, partial [Paludibacteraceae bacterium]|nr:leucine-rich repeat domain-containing protein [Paludibacteraceae bacterium]
MENANYTIDTNTGELVFDDGIEIIAYRDIPEEEKQKIKSIVIPDSVKEINNYAFEYMEKLEKVIFPEGLERIGEVAFFSCKKLKEVIFPKSLRSIESKAFAECSALTHIVISRTTSSLEIKDEDYLEIEDEAFADCVRLSNVEMKEGAFETTILYDQVFENTAFLKELRKKDPLV